MFIWNKEFIIWKKNCSQYISTFIAEGVYIDADLQTLVCSRQRVFLHVCARDCVRALVCFYIKAPALLVTDTE